jgi:hypothetical protein
MNAQDVQRVIGSLPVSAVALRSAVAAGVMKPRENAYRFEAPLGSLDDAAYDAIRSSDYLLSCTGKSATVEVGFLTVKKVIPTPEGACYHATSDANETGVRSSGMLIGRNVTEATARGGQYPDSQQYIHACLTRDKAAVWYYNRFGQTRRGVVLEIDLAAAGARLIADPRSEDAIIDANRIAPENIKPEALPLPSLTEMQEYLRARGWTWKEVEITGTIEATHGNSTCLFRGRELPGAWWDFYQAVTRAAKP